MAKKNGRFQKNSLGSSGSYTCEICGKRTRETGGGESDLGYCRFCYETSMFENGLSDHGHPDPWGMFEDLRPNLDAATKLYYKELEKLTEKESQS